eukprot:SM000249S08250  [mRNA]  locus=s249:162912:164026:- [translate_table: standard]
MAMEPLLAAEPRRVLIAIDGSDGAALAFDWALRNYCRAHDHVHLVHVRRSLGGADSACQRPSRPPAAGSVVDMEAQVVVAAGDLIDKYCNVVRQAKVRPCPLARSLSQASAAGAAVLAKAGTTILVDGTWVVQIKCEGRIVVGEERDMICREVMHVCADILILGSRGLNAAAQLSPSFGSTSNFCAHHCASPVIVVRPAVKGATAVTSKPAAAGGQCLFSMPSFAAPTAEDRSIRVHC